MKIQFSLKEFVKFEAFGGILLIIAMLLAMLMANTPLRGIYHLLIEIPVEVRVGPLELAKPLILWINDGLMAVFFFLVGLELKRELMEGRLAEKGAIALPMVGAVGGMLLPSLIYTAFNWDDPIAVQGWAIPAATDIAFALGVISLLGSRVPMVLKIFLVSLAIFDDIGAIIIIAIFYTENLSFTALLVAGICILVLLLLNRSGQARFTPYILVGVVMWIAVLKSGVHATLAGVLLAMFIPMRDRNDPERSPVTIMEHDLQSVVAFFILPLFAFVNSGVSFIGLGLDELLHSVPMGIAVGLFVGKQLGVFFFCWLGVKIRLFRLPVGMNWLSLYGVAVLCGIGFTMSLFIGSLSFGASSENLLFDERLGIILGSFLSAILGYLVLRYSLPEKEDRVYEQAIRSSVRGE